MPQCKEVAIRICTVCGDHLPEIEYYKYRNKLHSECKKCKKLRNKLRNERITKQLWEEGKKKERRGESNSDIIKEFNKILQKLGVNWLKELKENHEKKWGKKDERVMDTTQSE